jgi:hypothetical protein
VLLPVAPQGARQLQGQRQVRSLLGFRMWGSKVWGLGFGGWGLEFGEFGGSGI